MVKLKAPPGVCSTTFGGRSYSVDLDGCVNVPDEAVSTLTGHWHKFELASNAMIVGDNRDAESHRKILTLPKR